MKVVLKLLDADLGITWEFGEIPTALKKYLKYNPKTRLYHALPMHFYQIVNILEKLNVDFEVKFETNWMLENPLDTTRLELREYQVAAKNAWDDNNKRGVIVLPTGAGKTYVAMAMIAEEQVKTLVVVPTLTLVEQWRNKIKEVFNIDAGILTGEKKEIRDLTVSTYDSALNHYKLIRKQFGFMIFDEVHHLPATSYRKIAELSIAPMRLGLSATPERSDMLHEDLDELVGKVVYRIEPEDLKGKYLANFVLRRIIVDLLPDEREEYEKNWNLYMNYIKKRNLFFTSGRDFEKYLLKRLKWDREARLAIKAHHAARKISFNARNKITEVGKILEQHLDDKVIIFCEFIDMAEEVSSRFVIPLVTSKTPAKERKTYIASFCSGKYSKIVTGKVLDEGFDVSDANVAILISGSGTRRQFIQRLGRILRPKKEVAVMYEIVTRGTMELKASARRKKQE